MICTLLCWLCSLRVELGFCDRLYCPVTLPTKMDFALHAQIQILSLLEVLLGHPGGAFQVKSLGVSQGASNPLVCGHSLSGIQMGFVFSVILRWQVKGIRINRNLTEVFIITVMTVQRVPRSEQTGNSYSLWQKQTRIRVLMLYFQKPKLCPGNPGRCSPRTFPLQIIFFPGDWYLDRFSPGSDQTMSYSCGIRRQRCTSLLVMSVSMNINAALST